MAPVAAALPYIVAVASVAGAGLSAAGSIQQANAQREQAEFQSKMAQRNAQIAEQNAQLAEEQGREAKKAGYENAVRKRQEAAQIIGGQRAGFGASGAQVDQGAALDATLDTAEKGELDALHSLEQGQWQDYDQRVRAWGLRNDRDTSAMQASALRRKGDTGYLNLISGLGRQGVSLLKTWS